MMAHSIPRRLSKSEEAHINGNIEQTTGELVSGEKNDAPPLYDKADLFPEYIGDGLREQAFCNIGVAATVHKAIQTDDGGMKRIIYVGRYKETTRVYSVLTYCTLIGDGRSLIERWVLQ